MEEEFEEDNFDDFDDRDGSIEGPTTQAMFYVDKNVDYTEIGGASYAYSTYAEANAAASGDLRRFKLKVLFDSDNYYEEEKESIKECYDIAALLHLANQLEEFLQD